MKTQPEFLLVHSNIVIDLKLISWILFKEHIVQSRIRVLYAIVRRVLVGSHRQIAHQPVHMDELACRQKFLLDLFGRTSDPAPIEGEFDNYQLADSSLKVLPLSRRDPEGPAVRVIEPLAR